VAVQIVSYGYIMRDDQAIDSSRLVVKKIKITQSICQKKKTRTSFGVVTTLSAPRTIQNAPSFWAECQAYILKRLHFFLAKSAMQNSVPLHIRLATFKCVVIAFFLFILICGEVFVA